MNAKKNGGIDQSHKPANQYNGPKVGSRVRFDATQLTESDLRKLRVKGQELPWGTIGTVQEVSHNRRSYFCFVELPEGERYVVDNFLAIVEVKTV
jgi:hypothetical protein